MLAQDEVGLLVTQAHDGARRAEVPIGQPEVSGLCVLEHRGQARPFLRMRVLDGHHVHHQPLLRGKDHKRVSRKRGAPEAPKWLHSLLGGRQVVAIDDAHPVPLGERRLLALHGRDDGGKPLGALLYQRSDHPPFHAVDFVVNGRHRDREVAGLGRRMQRGSQPHRHKAHHLHHRREHQLARVLPLPMLLEQGVHPLRTDSTLYRQPRHHAEGTLLNEPLQDCSQGHGTSPRNFPLGQIHGKAAPFLCRLNGSLSRMLALQAGL